MCISPHQLKTQSFRKIFPFSLVLKLLFFQVDDKSKILLLQNENLKLCKTSLFNLQKSCLSSSRPRRKMLNGLIKLVFTPEKLATSKATDKRKTGLKPLDQTKCIQHNQRFVCHFTGLIICKETVRKRLGNTYMANCHFSRPQPNMYNISVNKKHHMNDSLIQILHCFYLISCFQGKSDSFTCQIVS